jgi:uncharacterized protein (DUF427 family)
MHRRRGPLRRAGLVSRPHPIPAGPGQESVWDYPRPPRLELSTSAIQVVLGGEVIVETNQSFRVLETASPPTYYLNPADFVAGVVQPAAGESWCEWKGQASYVDLVAGGTVARRAAWRYLQPNPSYAALAGWLAIYPSRVDRCTVDGEEVRPQDGDFYGGWITSNVVGPFKGEAGTLGW